MEDIHVHAENRLYKVYGPGPASFMDKVYAHMRGLGTIWLLSIIPFVIVYINTFNVQYGLTVSFFVVLIELGKHLSFYDGPPRAFLVLEYYPNEESGYQARIPRNESENSVSECNSPSECNEDEGEETTIETSCETDGIVDESSCEGEGNVSDHPCEGEEESDEESEDQPEQDCTEETQCCSKDQEETSNLESPSESAEPTEKNETTEETPCEPVESTKED